MKILNKTRKIDRIFSGAVLIGLILLLFLSLPVFPAVLYSASISSPQESPELKELDRVLKVLETFDHSQGEGPSLELERLVFRIKDNPEMRLQAEKKMLEFLSRSANCDAWIAVSKPLSWIPGVESVKGLSAYLTDPQKSDPARYVLERIPGEEADRALINALEKASPEVAPGLVSSLGQRRAASSILSLEKLLKKNPSAVITSSVLEALGNIGGEEAVKILVKYLNSSSENARRVAVDSLLRLANREVEKNAVQAAQISDRLLRTNLTPEQKLAAWRIKILSARDKAPSEIQVALKTKETEAHQAALGLIPQLVPVRDIDSYLPLFSKLSENELIQLAAVLAHYPTPGVREYLVELVSQSPSADVRTEAINSLGKIGDSSTVEFLVKKAASARGREKSAARESLVALRGKAVDEKILELLATTSDQVVKNELFLACCERNIKESRDYFVKEAANPSADPALVARGLRTFGDISLAEELLDITFKTEDEAFQEELTDILAGWAKQSARPEARSSYFRNLLSRENQPEKQAILISIIGKIGERNSLPLLRNYVKNQNPKIREAAIRALSDWPEVEARDDLMLIARSSADLKEKVLAIRGLVRLTASERYRRPEAAVETLKDIYSLCPRAEEKKMVLAALADFPCEPGLVFCQSLMNDPEVGVEARAAVDKIKRRI